MIHEKLIFDLGAYMLDSTEQYLNEYKIVAVEANDNLYNLLLNKYNESVTNGNLILINKAITDKDDEIVNFYVQDNCLVWSSIDSRIAEREDFATNVLCKNTTTLKTLIETYSTPLYCKIDIEGADILAIKSLEGYENLLPKYISCETECLGIFNKNEINGTEIIDELHTIGYKKFFLKKQYHDSKFTFDIYGEYDWVSYEEIKEKLLKERENHDFKKYYDFWYDVYATF